MSKEIAISSLSNSWEVIRTLKVIALGVPTLIFLAGCDEAMSSCGSMSELASDVDVQATLRNWVEENVEGARVNLEDVVFRGGIIFPELRNAEVDWVRLGLPEYSMVLLVPTKKWNTNGTLPLRLEDIASVVFAENGRLGIAVRRLGDEYRDYGLSDLSWSHQEIRPVTDDIAILCILD